MPTPQFRPNCIFCTMSLCDAKEQTVALIKRFEPDVVDLTRHSLGGTTALYPIAKSA